jgi:hypothetical protein
MLLLASYRPFVSFWSVKNLTELADGPVTLHVGGGGARAGHCFVSSANQLLLSLCKWLAPSLPLENFAGQNLTNELYLSPFIRFVLVCRRFNGTQHHTLSVWLPICIMSRFKTSQFTKTRINKHPWYQLNWPAATLKCYKQQSVPSLDTPANSV